MTSSPPRRSPGKDAMDSIDYLRDSLLFEELTEEELARVAAIGRERTFEKDTEIIREDDMGDSLFLILDGSVRVYKTELSKEEEVINTLYVGDHFGEIALIDHQPRSATVVANETCRMLEIKRDDFQRLLETDDALALKIYRAFVQALCQRIRETTESFVFLKTMGNASRIVD
ncbi:MAG: cyclic nucleotide-binding domain-containing protein [Deltaproteobacteria bacterium]|nr:MAG: cyclic nucleotide-binding domain-containing protein [Deltaproteobacteria bacterium]